MTPTREPWSRILGPWPLRPVLEFFVVLLISILISSGQISAARQASLAQVLVSAFVPAIAIAIPVGVSLWLMRRFARRWTEGTLPGYLAASVIAAACGFAVRVLLARMDVVDIPESTDLRAIGFARTFVWIYASMTVAGFVMYRLGRQERAATDALLLAREQQELMLMSEERYRRQVAMLLHDRVQAGMIAASLELQLIQGADGQADVARARAIAARLEQLRELDVRQAARTLSPDLENLDIRSALSDLFASYLPAVDITLEIAPELTGRPVRVSADVMLGCYRVIEQGLLNAVGHGRASRCSVALSWDSGQVGVSIEDNGAGFDASEATAGFGSAVLTTWARVLGGTWNWTSQRGEGTQLIAHFPADGVGVKAPDTH